MNKKAFAIIILLVLSYFGYQSCKYQKMELNHIDQAQTITLIADAKIVVGLEVYIEGHLDDTAKIQNIFIGPGAVNTQLHTGDWYVDTFRMKYDPYKVKEGNLKIKYFFNTMN